MENAFNLLGKSLTAIYALAIFTLLIYSLNCYLLIWLYKRRSNSRRQNQAYLDNVVVPSEIPIEVNSFKSQQFRWAKGSIQTALKLFPLVLKNGDPLFKKLEAFLHLTGYLAHPLMLLVVLLSLPLTWLSLKQPQAAWFSLAGMLAFLISLAFFGPLIMYVYSQKVLHPDWLSRLLLLPSLIALGTGLSVNNSRAVLEALLKLNSPFVRTPKFGLNTNRDKLEKQPYRLPIHPAFLLEIGMGIYCLAAIYFSLLYHQYALLPFMTLYALGFLYLGCRSLGTTLLSITRLIPPVSSSANTA